MDKHVFPTDKMKRGIKAHYCSLQLNVWVHSVREKASNSKEEKKQKKNTLM